MGRCLVVFLFLSFIVVVVVISMFFDLFVLYDFYILIFLFCYGRYLKLFLISEGRLVFGGFMMEFDVYCIDL